MPRKLTVTMRFAIWPVSVMQTSNDIYFMNPLVRSCGSICRLWLKLYQAIYQGTIMVPLDINSGSCYNLFIVVFFNRSKKWLEVSDNLPYDNF